MSDSLDDLSFRQLRARCAQLGIRGCTGRGVTAGRLREMIREEERRHIPLPEEEEKEEEEEEEILSYSPGKRVPSPKLEDRKLSGRLGSSLDEFARDLEEFISQFLRSELRINFSYSGEVGLGYSDSSRALYYSDPEDTVVSGSYFLVEFKGENVVVTLFSVLYDYNVSRDPNFDHLDRIARIANYGIERFSTLLLDALKEERITIGDSYTLLSEKVEGRVTIPEKYLPPNVESDYASAMGFATIITFNVIDEKDYREGGHLYEEGRKRFEGRNR